ncbi:MAG TPA: molybdopterin molybdotransferase MoeA, partial [Fimbriimonadaceae bacterium]|nr:molybdopterin molybdotransferase MoeA [Fimbriimonadaceae bacterium]
MTSYHEALHTILDNVDPRTATTVFTSEARGLYLAEEVLAPIDSPPFDDSAVDGFAVIASDTPGTLRLVGSVYAGDDPAASECKPGTCVKTMTGAGIAPGADAVVMQEDTSVVGDAVEVKIKKTSGANIRKCGAEFHAGDLVLHKGSHLNPASLSLAGSLGMAELRVHAPPRVGVLVTGEELVAPGETIKPGQRYESNSIALAAMAQGLTGRPAVVKRVGDDAAATKRVVEEMLSECDVLVTSGGASVGEKDLVRGTLAACGAKEFFWGVSIKPGKPVSFSVAPTGCRVFALPG